MNQARLEEEIVEPLGEDKMALEEDNSAPHPMLDALTKKVKDKAPLKEEKMPP